MPKILTIPVKTNFTPVKRTVFGIPRSGIECMFVQLTKNVGIKIYRGRMEAESSCERQTKAHKIGVAPKVMSRVKKCYVGNLLEWDCDNIFDSDDPYCYCYMTQIAKCPTRYRQEEKVELKKRMEKARLPTWDLHGANLGRIGKKLVAIDFGDESCC